MKIARLVAREIFDSQGLPTIACDLVLENGAVFSTSVPSGTSKGSYEASELRDGGLRLQGKGVLKAVDAIENSIAPVLIGQEPDLITMDMRMIELDGTENKSRLGANALLAVSMAISRAQAEINGLELYEFLAYVNEIESVSLPYPMFNLINGGIHAKNGLAIQEFMVMPVGVQSFKAAVETAIRTSYALEDLLRKRGKTVTFGIEGGISTLFESEIEALDILMEAIEKTEENQNDTIVLALDIAASQFYNPQQKTYLWKGKEIESGELVDAYVKLAEVYPIYSVEDGLDQADVQGWQNLMSQIGDELQVVGDDIFATNPAHIAQGIENNFANAAIIKPNQIGTVTETLQAMTLCKDNGLNNIVSHRSRETNDSFIVDLAVGMGAGQIKAGGCRNGEHWAKYNRLLTIEDSLLRSALDG